MASINPYLHFKGNAEEAFNFYKSVFGGEFVSLNRVKDTPEAAKLSPADQDKIMHVTLPVGKDQAIMGSDSFGPTANSFAEGNNVELYVKADSRDHADKLFNGLAKGGKITIPIADTFWGSYFGMLNDKFGIRWMIGYDAA